MFKHDVAFVPSTTKHPILGIRNSVLPIIEFKKNLTLREAPIFYFSSFFALFPFNQRDSKVDLSYKSLIFGVAFLVVSGVYSYLHLQSVHETEQSNINILLYTSYALLDIVLVVACVTAPIFSKTSIIAILQDFSKVDTVISRMHPNFEFQGSHSRQKLQICFTLGTTFFFALAYFAASQRYVFPSFTYLEFYIMPVTWLIIFQLDYLLVNLRKRFVFVNSQLKNFLGQTTLLASGENNLTVSPLNSSQLNDLNIIHFTLYKISSKINDSYSVQLLLMIPRVIFFSVLPLHYNIVTALVNDPEQNGDVTPWSHIFTLSYIILLISPIFHVVNGASVTVDQAEELHKLIHDLIDEDEDERMRFELLVISVQLLHRKIEFSVKHFFSLKPSLTTTILELIITYVIIILQFQDTLSSVSPIRLLLRPSFNPSSITPTLATRTNGTENITGSSSNVSYTESYNTN